MHQTGEMSAYWHGFIINYCIKNLKPYFMNIKLGALIVGGVAAFAYYKYSKMTAKEKKDIVDNLKQKGKKIYDEYIPAVKETIEKNYL